MDKYYSYTFTDFLSDPDFQSWVQAGCSPDHRVWGRFPHVVPSRAADYYRAINVVKELYDPALEVSQVDMDHEVERILSSTQHRNNVFVIIKRWFWVAAMLFTGSFWWANRAEDDLQPLAVSRYLKTAGTREVMERTNFSEEIVSFWLPDGSLAQLHPGAKMRLPANGFNSARREVFMSGDIFFDVVKNPKQPFFVYTEDLQTKVVGTSFLVETRSGKARVVVKTGKVLVLPLSGDEQREIAITPNQMVTYSGEARQLVKDLAEMPEILVPSINTTDFDFDNTPIEKVFDEIEHAYGIPIHFDKKTLNNCFLNVRMGDEPFEQKLDIICKTIGANFDVREGEVFIAGNGC